MHNDKMTQKDKEHFHPTFSRLKIFNITHAIGMTPTPTPPKFGNLLNFFFLLKFLVPA